MLAAVLLIPGPLTMIGAMILAGVAGFFVCRSQSTAENDEPRFRVRLRPAVGWMSLVVFVMLLTGLPILAALTGNAAVSLIDTLLSCGIARVRRRACRAPALAGRDSTDWTGRAGCVLAGYGAAQAVPGPLFTFAAFLGAVTTSGPTGLLGASIALLAVFLPSALLVTGVLPFWERLHRAPRVQRVLMGVNAGVVGLLAAALYDPVFPAGVTNATSLVVAALALVALTSWNTPAWAVVLGAAGAGALLL